MGRTILTIIAVLLALACGALGLQVLKSAADAQTLDKKLADMEARLKEEIASLTNTEQPKKGVAPSEQVRPRRPNLDDRVRSIETRIENLEKKAESSSGSSLPDFQKMTPEERQEWGKIIHEEMMRFRQKQARVFKEGMIKNIRSRIDESAEKLSLTPAQKTELDNLLSEQVDKGFEMFMRSFQEGNLEGARSKIQKLVEETDEKVKEILNPDQIEKLKELDPNGFGRREQRRLEQQNK
jgi:DNA-binding MarR family transcriptional regulator